MTTPSINNARKLLLGFYGCLGAAYLCKDLHPVFVFIWMGGAFASLGFAWEASHCPHCEEYLTYKRVWVGKFCKHCGTKIEVPESESDSSSD